MKLFAQLTEAWGDRDTDVRSTENTTKDQRKKENKKQDMETLSRSNQNTRKKDRWEQKENHIPFASGAGMVVMCG